MDHNPLDDQFPEVEYWIRQVFDWPFEPISATVINCSRIDSTQLSTLNNIDVQKQKE